MKDEKTQGCEPNAVDNIALSIPQFSCHIYQNLTTLSHPYFEYYAESIVKMRPVVSHLFCKNTHAGKGMKYLKTLKNDLETLLFDPQKKKNCDWQPETPGEKYTQHSSCQFPRPKGLKTLLVKRRLVSPTNFVTKRNSSLNVLLCGRMWSNS